MLPLTMLLALVGANVELEQGIALYRAGQPGPALEHLLAGLDQPAAKKERAQMRLYIGLIQWSFKREPDARTQFSEALELDPKIELPRDAPDGAAALFRSLRPEASKVPPKRRAEPVDKAPPPVVQPSERLLPSDTNTDFTDPLAPTDVSPTWIPSAEEPAPIEQEAIPTYTWVILGTGGAAFVAGSALALVAVVNGRSALDEPDKASAQALHRSADRTTSASLIAFVASGVLIGTGALTLTF